MGTDNVVTSQQGTSWRLRELTLLFHEFFLWSCLFSVVSRRSVGFPLEVIPVEEDDQKRSEQAAVPVLEAVPSVTTPAMDAPAAETMPSTEMALIAAEPTGAGLGMPKEYLVVPGPSTVQYDVQRLPEDQVGAAKAAMVQVELMAGDAKRA